MDGSIFILDYSDFEREKIKNLLKLIGEFDVRDISSAAEFYSQIDGIKDISLIIMDIAFPNEAEGFEILGSLKKGSCRNVPVIITTRSDKLEYRDKAAKMGANDYVVKPYNSRRLESSIRSFIKVKNKFYYDLSGIEDISMTFDDFIEKQLYIAEAVKQPLSLIVISTMGTDDTTLLNDAEFQKKRLLACNTAIDTIKPMLSTADIVVSNQNKGIIVVLPLTDASFAKLCKEKVVENISSNLEKIGEKYSEHFYSVNVTYPDEGNDLQTLMKSALNKITDKNLYERVGAITEETKVYAKKIYNKYSRWF